jgi:hypothetical protein
MKVKAMTNRLPAAFAFFLLLFLHSCNEPQVDYSSIEGSWRCEEYNPYTGNSIYMVDIDRSKSDTTVYLISNFHNQDVNEFIYSRLRNSVLTIPDQVIGTISVKSGSGTVRSDFQRIDLVYTVTDGESEGTIEARYLRPE